MNFRILVSFLLLCAAAPLFPQYNVAFDSAPLQQSPLMIGAGGAGVALPVHDGFGFYLNPSHLGMNNNTEISSYFMIDNAVWLAKDLYRFRNNAASISYNLQNTRFKLPISVGFGYYKTVLSLYYSTFQTPYTGEEQRSFNPFSTITGLSFSVGYHSWFDFAFGLTAKNFRVQRKDQFPDILEFGNDIDNSISALDVGGMASFPLLSTSYIMANGIEWNPSLLLTIGTSVTNIGGKIGYFDNTSLYALPRTSNLGYSLNLKTDMKTSAYTLRSFEYFFTIEANAGAFADDTVSGGVNYQNAFYGLRPFNDLVLIKSAKNTSIHRGHVMSLFETIYLSYGTENYNGYGSYVDYRNAYIISTEGLSKIALSAAGPPVLRFLLKHIVLEYQRSYVHTVKPQIKGFPGLDDSKYEGLMLRIKDFDAFF